MHTLTCGHKINYMNDGAFSVSLRDYERHNRVVKYMTCCEMCYIHAKRSGELLYDEAEEMRWLDYNFDMWEAYNELKDRIEYIDERVNSLETSEMINGAG